MLAVGSRGEVREGNKCQHSNSFGAHAGTLATALSDCTNVLPGDKGGVLTDLIAYKVFTLYCLN